VPGIVGTRAAVAGAVVIAAVAFGGAFAIGAGMGDDAPPSTPVTAPDPVAPGTIDGGREGPSIPAPAAAAPLPGLKAPPVVTPPPTPPTPPSGGGGSPSPSPSPTPTPSPDPGGGVIIPG